MSMDKETLKRLAKFGQSIPKDMLKRGIIKTKPFEEDKQRLQDMAKNGKTLTERRQAQRALADERVYNSLNRETTEINQEVHQELDRRATQFIQKEMRAGRIKPLSQNDPFVKMVTKNFNKK